jgi:tetratricopeptide (TPR) repeat protein
MARGTQHRKRRPAANARVATQQAPKPKRAKHQSWEDQLFFSRLRVHAKWVFVFLALAFGLGFVLFGVGSGSSGITEAMQNLFQRSSGGSSSLSSLQKKAKEHPKRAQAWRDLATKLEQDQKIDRAIVALQHYIRLSPKDEGAIEEIAGMYTRRAGDYLTIYRQIQVESQLVSPNSAFRPAADSSLGKAFQDDPILKVQNDRLTTKANAALSKLGVLNSQSENSYKRLVKLAPSNATYQIQLAEVATNLGDKPTAIKAFKAFLKLAPNDSLAPRARQALKQLSAPTTTKTKGR